MSKTKAKTDDRPLIERARSAIPEYDELGRAIDALATHVKTAAESIKAEADPLVELRAEVRRAVLAGDSLPADLGARVVQAEDRKRAREAELELIGRKVGRHSSSGLIGELIEERQLLVAHESGPAFAVLRGELDEILEATREADKALGGVRNMEAAVRAGADQAGAWAALLGLVDRYDAVRQAQYDLVTHAMGGTLAGPEARRLLEPVGYVRNMTDLDPAWRARMAPPPKLAPGETGLAPGKPVPLSSDQPAEFLTLQESPWPAPRLVQGAGHWPTDDKPAFMRWLVSGEPEPWLPAMDELRGAHAEASKRPTNGEGASGPSKAEKRFDRKLERDRRYHESIAADEEERQRIKAGRD